MAARRLLECGHHAAEQGLDAHADQPLSWQSNSEHAPALQDLAAAMTRLSVNLNKVALLRNSRASGHPQRNAPRSSRWTLARTALRAPASRRPAHPRSATSTSLLLCSVRKPASNSISKAIRFMGSRAWCATRGREQCTLVPDDPGASTSDHGWDLGRDRDRLQPVIAELKAHDIRVSLFMDPDGMMAAARALGADRVELYTEPYARAYACRVKCTPSARTLPRHAPHTSAGSGGQRRSRSEPAKSAAIFWPGTGRTGGIDRSRLHLPMRLETGLAQAVRDYLAAIDRGTGAGLALK